MTNYELELKIRKLTTALEVLEDRVAQLERKPIVEIVPAFGPSQVIKKGPGKQ